MSATSACPTTRQRARSVNSLAFAVGSLALMEGCGSHAVPGGFNSIDGGPLGDDSGDPFGEAGSFDSINPPPCNPSPDNFDIPNNKCDDDGDGTVDNANLPCDQGLQEAGGPADFAKAIGLCKSASKGGWGVVSATFGPYSGAVIPKPEQHGILTKFGDVLKPREGASLGVLSSGWAREYEQCSVETSFKFGCEFNLGGGVAPPGFPKASPSCPKPSISSAVNDVIDFKLVIKVPTNAKGMAFDFNFLSGEWPEYVCSNFNDSFIAYLKSSAFNGGKPDNISFDAKQNPVSVNSGFFNRCSPTNLSCANFPLGYQACTGGDSELMGTGFYSPGDNCMSGTTDSGGGGTGWLTTKAPVQPGETITLEFIIWDTADAIFDSSVLLDNFVWEASDTSVGTTRPPPK